MPICRGCKDPFKNHVDIDGKRRNLNRRKYCLECSPFGEHNTKPYLQQGPLAPPGSMNCPDCTKVYVINSKVGDTSTRCAVCTAKRARKIKKQACVDFLGGECVICHYSRALSALKFHHVDESAKDFNLSAGNRSLKTLQEELMKCILVCGNCHDEIHNEGLNISHIQPGPRPLRIAA